MGFLLGGGGYVGASFGWISEGPYPTKRMQRRTIQLGRSPCSYCPNVQRWTKILGFLYYDYRTVINLSAEGHLEKRGWGYGGVWLGVVFDTSGKFAAY